MNKPSPGIEQLARLGRRSIIGRSLGIVVTTVLLGPLIGGIVVMTPFLASQWYGGRLAAAPSLTAERMLELSLVIVMASYLLGLLPALSFGILLSISAFWFRADSVWTAGTIALLAVAISFLIMSMMLRPSLAQALEFLLTMVPAAIIAGLACWLLTKPLRRIA